MVDSSQANVAPLLPFVKDVWQLLRAKYTQNKKQKPNNKIPALNCDWAMGFSTVTVRLYERDWGPFEMLVLHPRSDHPPPNTPVPPPAHLCCPLSRHAFLFSHHFHMHAWIYLRFLLANRRFLSLIWFLSGRMWLHMCPSEKKKKTAIHVDCFSEFLIQFGFGCFVFFVCPHFLFCFVCLCFLKRRQNINCD